jgi:hypothetical protein
MLLNFKNIKLKWKVHSVKYSIVATSKTTTANANAIATTITTTVKVIYEKIILAMIQQKKSNLKVFLYFYSNTWDFKIFLRHLHF